MSYVWFAHEEEPKYSLWEMTNGTNMTPDLALRNAVHIFHIIMHVF